jgi:diacylglycerol kinase (ATP)
MRRIYHAFFFSMDGLSRGFRTETAIRQEMLLLLIATPLAFWLGRSFFETAILISVLLMLLAVELLNTAIEKLCDHVRPERHDDIKFIKDLGSAAVFCLLIVAGLFWAGALFAKLFG